MEIILVAAILGFFFVKSFKIIPARRVAIEERLGRFYRQLNPGWYWVWWPFSRLRAVRWTYINQKGNLVIMDTDHLSRERVQMDIPPIKCLSKDKMRVTVDGTVMYTITDVPNAVYETDDTLNLFYQRVTQAVHQSVAKFAAEELTSMKDDVTASIEETVNDAKFPIRLHAFVLQEVRMDARILEANQEIYAQARQQKMRIAAVQAEQELKGFERVAELAELEHEREKQAARIAMQLEYSKAEKEKRDMQWADFTVEQRIELERVHAMAAIGSDAKKIVYWRPNWNSKNFNK